jgi:Kef-type K+ transport system membrane component KefB
MNEFLDYIIQEFTLPLSNPVLVFSLILFIILLAPILLRKLRIPGIIGLIISGVIIGPFGFNFLEKNSAVDLFSTIGLLYIMFIAGLDLDLGEFKSNRNKSILFGFFTFIIPLIIGFPVCQIILGYDNNASLLVASMFSTHTLVAYPIVSRLGVSKNQAVAVTVGGTILTDTAVLLILAIIMGNHEGTLSQGFWIRLGVSLVIFLFIMFYLVPRVTRWFFNKLESEKHAHYIFVLAVVFFSAFLAELSGLEPIIGAFVAGLALNQLIPQSSALMNRIEFIGNSLFIPFFLISVGMLVDISVVLNGPQAIIIASVLTAGAIFGKWLAAFFTQLAFKYTSSQRQIIFGLSTSHAAATLAVILVGYNAGILDKNILNGTIILILVTCVVASIATERAAKKIVYNEKQNIISPSEKNMFYNEHILLPIANLMNIEKLLEFTLLIKDKKSVNPVTVLSVVPNNAEAEINIISARKKLEEYKKHGAAAEIKINTIATIDLNATAGISRIAKEIVADIIVLGWPKKAGILEKLIGEKIYSIINNIDKNLFICHQEKLLVMQKRIIVLAPPLAEKEIGFEIWLHKILKLSKELSISIVLFGLRTTYDAVKSKMEIKKWRGNVSFHAFSDWDDFLVLTDFVNDDDLMFLISARKNAVSYQKYLDHIPSKLEKHFHANNKIMVYPQQNDQITTKKEKTLTIPISKEIVSNDSMNKRIGNFFKKKSV